MNTTALYIISIFGISLLKMPSNITTLPAVFENDLISLFIPVDNDTLSFYTDTGGKNFLYKSGISKLDVRRSKKNLWETSKIEEILIAGKIPIPYVKDIYFTNDKSSNYIGMFGREWFANKIWEFDYENETLKHLKHSEKNLEMTNQTVNLYFKSDSLGNHKHHLARIEVVVETDTLSMLFDSGAQAYLSAEAQKVLNKKELVATSFINTSTFDRLKNAYPEWIVLQGADVSFGRKSDIIIVPEVTIGNKTIGPVEFVRREDSNFEVMSDLFMDKRIIGALGGNALSELKKFTIDYKAGELILKN